jgi:hypothetical protein
MDTLTIKENKESKFIGIPVNGSVEEINKYIDSYIKETKIKNIGKVITFTWDVNKVVEVNNG